MVVHPRRNHKVGTPVLYLGGGPGAPSLFFVELLTASPHIQDVVVDRPWVFFDQRGQGRSLPLLRCPRESDYFKQLELCRDVHIRNGVDLSQYNSPRSAADIEQLRKALGFTQWNLWGVSYGSRLAFAVARDFPATVRSIVHDGPSYVEGLEIVDDFRGTDIAIHKLISRCAVDPACGARYPDLRGRFLAVLPQLRQRPLSIGEERIDDSRVVNFVRSVLFSGTRGYEERLRELPAYLDAAARSDGATILRIEKNMPPEANPFEKIQVPEQGRYAMGQNVSVECFDERGFESREDYRRAAAKSVIVDALFGDSMGQNAFRECALWPSGRADPARKSRVHYDGPQLAFSGEFDPSLSGMSGYEMEMLYSSARNVIFTGAGHVQASLADYPTTNPYRHCALSLGREFLADPFQPLDARCATTRTLRLDK
jgi:pimeloyl-ACP methyl ester carboxylesterase